MLEREKLPAKIVYGQRAFLLLLSCADECPGTITESVQIFITTRAKLLIAGHCNYCGMLRHRLFDMTKLKERCERKGDEINRQR